MQKRLGRMAFLVMWLGLIFFSSTDVAGNGANRLYLTLFALLGLPASQAAHFAAQKSIHVFLFAVLGWTVSPLPAGGQLRQAAVSASLCLMVGTLSEGLQFFFPGRQPTISDVLLNGLSGAASSLLRLLV